MATNEERSVPEETVEPEFARFEGFSWGADGLELRFRIDPEGVARLDALTSSDDGARGAAAGAAANANASTTAALPLVEIQAAGHGREWSGDRTIDMPFSRRLRYQGHAESREGSWHVLRVDLADPVSGLTAQMHYRSPDGVAAVQSWAVLTNRGSAPLTLEAVTSFAVSGFAGAANARDSLADLDVLWADSDWLAEGRWQRAALRSLLVDTNRAAHEHDPRGCFARGSKGSWSTGQHLPTGALVARGDGRTLLWQVESAGGWRWEVGERAGAAYLATLGPTDREHQWRHVLEPGGTFTTVPAAVALGATTAAADGLTSAIAAMTRYRRALRRPHPDHDALPVIYNDYMNTLMGNPTTERLLPLIAAAAEVGAEYFVIDAGWYDDAEGWWDSVGAWEESRSRFPGGLGEVLGRIREAGMTPGLWLEPEVVGVRSPVADKLPAEAFFQRDGARVVENRRYHLDLRHPEAVKHLDRVADRLAAEYGVGYLKLDYNINPGPGTKQSTDGGPGAGLLGHQRAYAAWLDAILDRHPGLTVESCASGGMRADYALLAHAQIQSTSDQQDLLRYPPIAVAAPASIAPEQAASWAYPQPDFTDDEIAFTLCTALLGRVHLSGHLNRMSPAQRALVAQAVAAYKQLRADIANGTPFWPLGLPGWTDPWLALGLRGAEGTYLTVWRRGGGAETSAAETNAAEADADKTGADAERVLSAPHLRGENVTARVLFPESADGAARWNPEAGELTVRLPTSPSACLVTVSPN
jgi:alpha-galactosidase